jgi:hypothetical protein
MYDSMTSLGPTLPFLQSGNIILETRERFSDLDIVMPLSSNRILQFMHLLVQTSALRKEGFNSAMDLNG